MEQQRREHDDEMVPEIAELGLTERRDGPAAAAMLAAGIGIFALGLLTVLSEASASVHDWLGSWDFDRGVGPLAGKTLVAVIVWAASWIVLALGFRDSEVDVRTWFWVSLALGVLGLLGTFPPIFTAFASD